GLDPGEELPADDLRVGGQQRQAAPVPIARDLVETGVGERGLELDIASEQRPGRAHQGIADVVADARERARADEGALAELFAAAAYRLIARVIGRQAHARPGLERGTLDIAPALHVALEGSAVVEKVEPDELDPLVLEVDQRAVDAAPVAGGPEGPGGPVTGG